ncbi:MULTISPECIES: hypothetical protein [Bacillus cereus group]|uniref:Uncharacterized protein n=1 Tax=Bacillus mycoides TaxID=1405 RepID=A0A1D3MIK1_BACMY|nr:MULTISPECIES: hypothetical protein [Bacillus cereus group]EJV56489.1 hypothetical protein IEM_05190 [Bacillus cereus BAG6O-2]OFD96835.1 hypothetical protein BWGOE11_18530 [Bacillus mycoides]OFE02341.1 hypothetical protein BWGOE13_18340 [Bacillus mycoides]OHX32171.1 hypothetical protein BWGOE5_18650 [Bacillus mycoides]SCM85772.1 Uncharacterized protein BWAI21_01190 [Bacillus mycoides]
MRVFLSRDAAMSMDLTQLELNTTYALINYGEPKTALMGKVQMNITKIEDMKLKVEVIEEREGPRVYGFSIKDFFNELVKGVENHPKFNLTYYDIDDAKGIVSYEFNLNSKTSDMEINKFIDFIEGQITGVHLEVFKAFNFPANKPRNS